MSLEGEIALVTGASAGIGRGAATPLAAEGAFVIVTGRDIGRGAETAGEITGAGGEARFIHAGRACLPDVRRLAQEAGAAGILLSNAAIFPFAATADVDEATCDATFSTTVTAPLFLAGALAPEMAARGGGSISNVSSTAAQRGVSPLSSLRRHHGRDRVPHAGLGHRVRPTRHPRERRGTRPRTHPGHCVVQRRGQAVFVTGGLIAVEGGLLALQPPAPPG
ncbi:MAG TPA: SDR family NAD(P)-dependent oxidoreductase [Pseudonocardiaceae bacterium]|nr:SDR family NAD(P)-dependent oxidoreductase [Pseudonocardiaceae bacterium]